MNWLLNITLAENRNEIDNIALNHLRALRNIMINPNNLKIIIEENVNPDIFAQQISATKANTEAINVRKLPTTPYYNFQSASKDKPKM